MIRYLLAPADGLQQGDLRDGSSSPVIDRLASQLSRLDSAPAALTAAAPPILDATQSARVRAFQRAQSLKPDGQPGPMTVGVQSASRSGYNFF